MRRQVLASGLLALISSLSSVQHVDAVSILTSVDYAPATWVPAAASNYSVSNRPADYQVNMIVIHDIEGSAASAIAAFRDPNRHGSANYIVSASGQVTQMVAEKNIAWHAGNWDYNTRAIGIEHEGYAWTPGTFTNAEYRASAHLAASICSRWGVPMDRNHVIGHNQVPDPNNPGLFGGADHHTDPGPYWNWTFYMSLARGYAGALPSPPHMGPDPIAVSAEGGVTVSWQAAQSCTAPITGYSVLGQPGNIALTLPATAHSVWIPGLTDGVAYSFTVTAINAQGRDSLTSNTAFPGSTCTAAALTGSPSSPLSAGASIQFTATSTGCNSPEYAFWINLRGRWTLERDYGGAAWTWGTTRFAPGTYQLGVWARQKGSGKSVEAYGWTTYTLRVAGCLSAGLAPSVAPPQIRGSKVTFTASSTGCSSPQYQFRLLQPGGSWTVVQPYSAATTWLFDSSTYASGNLQVGVWVRQAGSANTFDTFFVSSYLVQDFFASAYWRHGVGRCVVSALNPSVASPLVAGASVTFTPQQRGCTNQYQFWLLPPGGSWRVVQAYGVGSTWLWNTAGYSAGVYQVSVWEGSSTTPTAYESYAVTSFTLGAATCGSAGLSPSVNPPQTPGAAITFTASSTGCPSPEYQFWLLPPGGAWTVKRAFGGATWRWDTAGLATGTYQLSVWARQSGSTAGYDAYFVGTYQLTVVACGPASIAASPTSPQATGAQITFSATSAGCSSPRYEFWELPPGGTWKLVQPYGTGMTFTWASTGAAAGDYDFAVWTVATGSPNSYDSYALTNFSING
jgi:hypothetical protein